MINTDHFPVYADAFNLLCGDKLGSGVHRDVFACRVRPDLVVKVEFNTDFRDFTNVREMQFWDDSEYCKAINKWLAPCVYLSPDGRILLQKRCEPIPQNYKLPSQLPAFLTDIKRENFGLLDGKLVCLDYGYVINNPSWRLKKVEW